MIEVPKQLIEELLSYFMTEVPMVKSERVVYALREALGGAPVQE